MRTRTIRWLLIGVMLVVPAATITALAVKVVDVRGSQVAPAPRSRTTACVAAANLAVFNPTAAVAQYQSLLNAKDAPADTPEVKTARAADRLCAAAALRTLQPPTLSDRIFQVADGVVSWAGRVVANRDLSLGPAPSPAVTWSVVVVEGALLLLGLRQFLLWRRERMAGPVSVGSIAAPTDDPNRTGLGEIIRDRLARAGVAPGTAVPGELGALVVDAVDVLGGDGEKNWLSQGLAALARAVRVTSGFVVTGKAFQLGDNKNPAVTLEIKLVRTGGTFAILTTTGASYEAAAIAASYELYLRLANRESVGYRTPSWLAWTSVKGLEHYHEALELQEIGDLRGALAHLDMANNFDPGNLLVSLRRGILEQRIALGNCQENVLRGLDSDRRGSSHLRAVRDLLQAELCAPGNDDAVFQMAIELSYVDTWADAFCVAARNDGELRRRIVDLISGELVKSGADPGQVERALGPEEDLGRQRAAVVAYFQERASAKWRETVERQRYVYVLTRSWRLAHRRETDGRRSPFSQLRRARRHCALAGLAGTEWDQAKVKGHVEAYRRRVRTRLRERRVRWAIPFLLPGQRGLVAYNLAAVYARKAVALENSPDQKKTAEENALKYLERSAIGSWARLGASDVDDFMVDPCFTELVCQDTFKAWAKRFGVEDESARCKRVWTEVANTVCQAAASAHDTWTERKLRLASGGERPAVVELLNWFRHDEAMWQALRKWRDEPAATAYRMSFLGLGGSIGRVGTPLDVITRERELLTRQDWDDFTACAKESAQRAEDCRRAIEAMAATTTPSQLANMVEAEIGPAKDRWLLLLRG